MSEVIRRLALIACLCGAGWLWFASPPLLISVRKADLARESQRRFGLFSQEDSGRGSGKNRPEEDRQRAWKGRTLPPPATDLTDWLQRLEEALEGRGPLARRVAGGEAYYQPAEEPVAQWVPALQQVYRNGSWLNAYLSVQGRDLEFRLHPEPRNSKAPRWILYPRRASAWKWALAGVLVYLLLPGRPRRPIRHDPIPILALDFVAAALIGFFWALPLSLYETNEAAVQSWLGGPLLSWLAAAAVLGLLLVNAAKAAFELEVNDDSIRVRRLLRSSEIPFSQIRAVRPLEQGGLRLGLRLELENGGRIALPWNGILNYSLLLDALAARGLYSGDR
jgi:hypothetical protein